MEEKIKEAIKKHCRKENISPDPNRSFSRFSPLPEIRNEIALTLINAYGVSLAETARRLGITTSEVAKNGETGLI